MNGVITGVLVRELWDAFVCMDVWYVASRGRLLAKGYTYLHL